MKINKQIEEWISVTKDCMFICFIIFLSSFPYINKIGFYNDDWPTIARLSLSTDTSFIGLFRAVNVNATYMRPVQNVLSSVLFYFFDSHTLNYQITNLFFLALMGILIYLVLRELRVIRLIRLLVAILYLLLPNYSTDRFWFSAFQANISSIFYFLSLWTGIKSISSNKHRSVVLAIVSIVCLIISSLAYEVIMPMYFLNLGIFIYLLRKKERRLQMKEKVLLSLTALVTVLIFAFKAAITSRLKDGPLHHLTLYPVYLIYLFIFSVWTNFFQLISEFISAWFKSPDDTISLLVSLIVGVLVYLYSYRVWKKEQVDYKNIDFFKIVQSGLVVFFLGFSIFLFNSNVAFSPSGMDNRVAIVGSMGVSAVLIGITGLISNKFLVQEKRGIVFCFCIALLCATGSQTITQISRKWSEAYSKEQLILASIQKKFPVLPNNSIFILDGACPYEGPVSVFAMRWDLKGALQMIYRDNSLKADVVTTKMRLKKNEIVTQYYTDISKYPYENIILYNIQKDTSYTFNSFEEADDYFRKKNYDFSNGCASNQLDPSNVTSHKLQLVSFAKLGYWHVKSRLFPYLIYIFK